MSSEEQEGTQLKEIDEAWLGLDIPEQDIFNPMSLLDPTDEDYDLKITWLLSRPEYFSFLCKHVFNIQILPSQALILHEMWHRKFPMLIASRGFGKSFMLALYAMIRGLLLPTRKVVIVGAAFRQSKVLFEYMETIWNGAPILRDMCDRNSGPRRDIDRCVMRINESRVTCLPLGDGCLAGDSLVTYDDCIGNIKNPQTSVWGNGKFRDIGYPYNNGETPTKLVRTKRGYSYESTHNHKMKVLRHDEIKWVRADKIKVGDRILIDRSERWHNGNFECSKDESYSLGAMIGDGCWTNKYYLGFATKDQEIIDRINRGFKTPFKQTKDEVRWKLYKKSNVSQFLDFWNLKPNCYTKDKEFPSNILKSSKENMTACLQGLFDTDGHVQVSTKKGTAITIGFTNTSEKLVNQMHYILLHYGIISTISKRDRNKKWNTVYELLITGKNVKIFADKINFHLSRKKHILNSGIKQKVAWNSIDDCVPISKKLVLKDIKGVSNTPTKSQLLRLKGLQFSTLNNIINVVGETSWSHLVDENIYYDTVVSIEDSHCHTYDINVPEDNEYCANGFFSHNTKIRGQRANDIISDEFASIPRDIFETVVAGFAAVSSDPIDNVRRMAAMKKAKELGIELDPNSDSRIIKKDNQIILSGTAYYDFNHFAAYWKKWRAIVKSCGRQGKLRELFNGEDPPEDFDWKEYSIIRIPYELLPPGFMDASQVARSKATVHAGIYQMEFGACLDPNTQITTSEGVKCIVDVKVGDMVLTHRGRFRKVTKKLFKIYKENIIEYKTLGYNVPIGITPNHPIWKGGDTFEPAYDFNHTNLVNLNELSGINEIYPELFSENVLETHCGDYIYPKGQSNLDINAQTEIRHSEQSQALLSNKYSVSQSAISYVKNNKNIPKNRVPSCLALDYNFGLIVGYYAAEGNISKNGNAVEMALDEHKDTAYQQQLLSAIYNTFGFSGKKYIKKKNTVVININSRIVADLFKNICPGLSGTKLVDHDILFSNDDFLRGFIESYWSGDGHIGYKHADAHCVNQSLLNQVRIGLSYFGVSSSLMSGSSDDYSLKISGDNYRKFLSIFYNRSSSRTNRKTKIINDGHKTITPVISKVLKKYNNLVYNLEVEEDNSYSLLNSTVHNCFTRDSEGFFKRSLIESCVSTMDESLLDSKGQPIIFEPRLMGDVNKRYVIGVDPASEVDNFSIVMIEINGDHNRIVYCWTTTRQDHKNKVQKGYSKEKDFYAYCARKIRDLMRLFNVVHIAMDAQGGGIAVMESLHDDDKIKAGEVAIWPVIDPDKEEDTDDQKGLHILEMCQFAKFEWLAEANHGLRKDFEDKYTLFPRFDAISIGISNADDAVQGRMFDTLEECVLELEDLKDELSMIQMTQTPTGRDKWDTPEVIVAAGKKSKLRKDRYSALIMANMAARIISRTPTAAQYTFYGGFAAMRDPESTQEDNGDFYNGPNWFTDNMNDIY